MPVDKFGRMSDVKTRDTGVSLTYINNNYVRSDGGTPVSGSIDMRGNTLYNMSNPVNPQDVATKEYADTANKAFIYGEGKYLAVGDGNSITGLPSPIDRDAATNKNYVNNGGAITKLPNGAFTAVSDIDFDGFSLKNIPDPIDGKDAVNKAYVDGRTIQPSVPINIKPIITVWAKEKGSLGDGHYEFSFGNGSSRSEHAYGGYCTSAPGRIIRGSLTATESRIILSQEVKVNIVVNGTESLHRKKIWRYLQLHNFPRSDRIKTM